MTRLFHLSSLLLLPTTCLLSGCAEDATEPLPRPATRQLTAAMRAGLQTDSVRLRPIETLLQLEGRVAANADRVTPVYALAGGVVEQSAVGLGDEVQQGQPLAVIRSTHSAELTQQRTESAVNLATAQQQLRTTQELYADGMASSKEVAEARGNWQKAQAEATRLRRQTAVYGSGSGYYTLRASLTGTIIEKDLAVGQQFEPGQVGSLFTLADLAEVWVLADVFQSDAAQVQPGRAVEIRTLSYPDRTFVGQVDKVFNLLDPARKTLQVRVRLPNPDHLLKPGMFARVQLTNTRSARLPAVPSASLIFANGRRYALVVKQHTVETRAVEVQTSSQGLSYISQGLMPGERVVTSNALLFYKQLND